MSLASSCAIVLSSTEFAASGTAISLPRLQHVLAISGFVANDDVLDSPGPGAGIYEPLGAAERVRLGGDPTLIAEAGIAVGTRAKAKAAGALGDFPAVVTCLFVSGRVHRVGEFLLAPPDPVGHEG